MAAKPRLFIGSSRESLPVAEALKHLLRDDAEGLLWNQGIFGISDYTLDSILKASHEFDFGAFIFGADDTVKIAANAFSLPATMLYSNWVCSLDG